MKILCTDKKIMICEFTHVMLKVCVKLAVMSAEWPDRRKTYGPGETLLRKVILP